LEYFLKAKNSFELAEKDLILRGHGRIYGEEQSGRISDLKLADFRDITLINEAKKEARALLEKDQNLINCPILKEKIVRETDDLGLDYLE
jgi:ATP-dependent DNA helicase RecG